MKQGGANEGSSGMSRPEHFEVAGDRAYYRPTGEVTFQQAVAQVSAAIAFARDSHIKWLLVNITGLNGFKSPGTLERFQMATGFAEAARTALKIAFVARREIIDPQHFGTTVARNRGLLCEVFESESDAVT